MLYNQNYIADPFSRGISYNGYESEIRLLRGMNSKTSRNCLETIYLLLIALHKICTSTDSCIGIQDIVSPHYKIYR